MRVIEVAESPPGDLRRTLTEFVEQIEARTGLPALSDHLRLDLANESGTPGPLVVTVTERGDALALAQISEANRTAVLEVVVDPDLDDAAEVRDDAAATAIDFHRRRGGHPVVWWLDDPTDRDRRTAATFGLAPTRELFEMRRPLPHPERAAVATRDFEPGSDEEAWLAVNNRAFADHGEQGGWTLDTLRSRMAEPWFDPAGFRIYEADGRLLAFCWTKLHHDHDPVVGEIYVIAVDPDAHGRGLGTQLTLAGLDSIADRGVGVANLYVDAANAPAVGLYERLGFHVHRRRVAFGAPT